MGRVLVFVGGLSGSGKTTFCNNVSGDWVHLTAGKLIAQRQAGEALKHGRPAAESDAEFASFQQTVLEAVSAEPSERIVLDGHFVAPTRTGEKRVPLWFFEHLSPKALYLVEASPQVLIDRLQARDSSSRQRLELVALSAAAKDERIWAESVASQLTIRLNVIDGERIPHTWTPIIDS